MKLYGPWKLSMAILVTDRLLNRISAIKGDG
jgi:hypothetical protein